jgi:hypothetical protein
VRRRHQKKLSNKNWKKLENAVGESITGAACVLINNVSNLECVMMKLEKGEVNPTQKDKIVVNNAATLNSYTYGSGFNPATLYQGKTVSEWINLYTLDLMALLVMNTSFTLNISFSFQDLGASSSVVAYAQASNYYYGSTIDSLAVKNIAGLPSNFPIVNAVNNSLIPNSRYLTTQAITRYWYKLANKSGNFEPYDMFITFNTRFLDTAIMDFSNSFTNLDNKYSFKGVVIHEIIHGLGCSQFIYTPAKVSSLIDASFFRSSQTVNKSNFKNAKRIGSTGGAISSSKYGAVRLNNPFKNHIVVMDNSSPSHIKYSNGALGIMEPYVKQGGIPFSVNDSKVLRIVGW